MLKRALDCFIGMARLEREQTDLIGFGEREIKMRIRCMGGVVQ